MSEDLMDWPERAGRAVHSAQVLVREGDAYGAVNRAYYAMFYVAEALLLSRGLEFSRHRAVINAYGKEFAQTGLLPARFHRDLSDAYQDRIGGDYDSKVIISDDVARRHIAAAKEFIAAAAGYLGPK